MNRSLILFLCSLFGFSSIAAADTAKTPIIVAVFDFTSDASLSNAAAQASSFVSASLSADANLSLLDRVRFKNALASLSTSTAAVSPEAVSKIAQNMGAKVLVSGQVIPSGTDRIIIMATVMMSASGQSFPAQVDGAPKKVLELSSSLSDKISHIINDHPAVAPKGAESGQDKLNRVIQSIQLTNKPSISITVFLPTGVDKKGNRRQCAPVETELGRIFLLAGFNVLEGVSKEEAEYELIGVSVASPGPKQGAFFTSIASLEAKIRNKKTGKVLAAERSGSTALNLGKDAAERIARSTTAADISEKILPVIATAITGNSGVR